MSGSLQGRRIVVTRAREQAGDLVRALEERGAVAVLAPVIRIQPVENLAVLRGVDPTPVDAIERLKRELDGRS